MPQLILTHWHLVSLKTHATSVGFSEWESQNSVSEVVINQNTVTVGYGAGKPEACRHNPRKRRSRTRRRSSNFIAIFIEVGE